LIVSFFSNDANVTISLEKSISVKVKRGCIAVVPPASSGRAGAVRIKSWSNGALPARFAFNLQNRRLYT
jgi:hypothetical protein